jgi:excisionase family DNA binding protein
MSEVQEKLLSAKEAVVRLGISKPTLSRLCRDKKIGFYRVGMRILFSEERHITPFLASCECKPCVEQSGREGARRYAK